MIPQQTVFIFLFTWNFLHISMRYNLPVGTKSSIIYSDSHKFPKEIEIFP